MQKLESYDKLQPLRYFCQEKIDFELIKRSIIKRTGLTVSLHITCFYFSIKLCNIYMYIVRLYLVPDDNYDIKMSNYDNHAAPL